MAESLFKKLAASVLSILIFGLAFAGDEKEVKFGDWLYRYGLDKAEPYCYAITTPFRTKTNNEKAEHAPLAMVRKKGDQMFTIGIDSRTRINKNFPLEVVANGTSRNLNVKLNKFGWGYSANLDAHLINDFILDGKFFTIRSRTENGEYFLDYYSLKGFEKMLRYMQIECSVGK